jgi:fluoride exporter
MNPLILTMAGGAIGAGARYLATSAIVRALGSGWPWGTLAVNVLGGFLMGLLVGRVADSGDPVRIILGIGVLGGFTTFSAFSLETVEMIQRGAWLSALGYAVNSVGFCVLALFLGLVLAR